MLDLTNFSIEKKLQKCKKKLHNKCICSKMSILKAYFILIKLSCFSEL